MDQHSKIKKEFKKQAMDFSDSQLTLNNQEYLSWILSSFDVKKEMTVLDVAAGTGILSRAFANVVKKVVSIDLSEDMVREGMKQNKLNGIKNIEYHLGNVEKLPFEDNQFDLVISRFAFHHFDHYQAVLAEMQRVCKTAGMLCVVDMISPEEDDLFAEYNKYEKLRDPSHTIALKKSGFLTLFKENQLVNLNVDTKEVDTNVEKWLKLSKTEESVAELISEKLNEEINGGNTRTGMAPFVSSGKLMFKQNWIKIIGNKR